MKRTVLGVSFSLGIFALACGGTTNGPECAKYIACCDKLGGSSAAACESAFGETGMCNSSTTLRNSCEDTCVAAYASIKKAVAGADAGTCD